MNVEHIHFIAEEPSTEMLLRALLPRILGEKSFEVFGGFRAGVTACWLFQDRFEEDRSS